MTPEQYAHLGRVINRCAKDMAAKYEAGQQEHGGNLWEQPGMLERALEEAIDQVIYLYTALEQRERGIYPNGRDV